MYMIFQNGKWQVLFVCVTHFLNSLKDLFLSATIGFESVLNLVVVSKLLIWVCNMNIHVYMYIHVHTYIYTCVYVHFRCFNGSTCK